MIKKYPGFFTTYLERGRSFGISACIVVAASLLAPVTLHSQTVKQTSIKQSAGQPTSMPVNGNIGKMEVNQFGVRAAESEGVTKTQKQGSVGEGKPQLKWRAQPFDHKIFVENLGQFNKDLPGNPTILFYAKVGSTKVYFTPEGVIYRNDQVVLKKVGSDKDEDGDPDANTNAKVTQHLVTAKWLGANSSVTLEGENLESFYYTYGVGKDQTIKANVYRKLVYHDVYPGIDLEYSFQEGKNGIKYNVIVHPGADIALLKLNYSGTEDLHMDANGNVVEHCDSLLYDLTDHAPVSHYEVGGDVNIDYSVSGRTESFSAKDGYDNSKTLIIDPWTTSITFSSGYDAGYDLDYDNVGNVYVYGGYDPFQLTKLNAAGVVQWTYNTSWSTTWLGAYTEGDFAVDKKTGTAYIGEGLDNNTGAVAIKVNTLGVLKGTFPGSAAMREMWRMTYNGCTAQVVIGGGGTNTPSGQVAMLDTNMSAIVPENPLATGSCCHDANRLATDPTGSTAFFDMATVNNGSTNGNVDNILMSVPVPSLSSYNYKIEPTGSAYLELASIMYVGAGFISGEATGNGMNGMAASPNWLYTYDGYHLQRLNKGTGAIISTLLISSYYSNYNGHNETNTYWGGLDADACDNVYVGSVAETAGFPASLNIYNSAFTLQSSTALPAWPFDVVLGKNNSTIYVCGGPVYWLGYSGTGYVEAFTNGISTVAATATPTNTTCGLNNGSATASLSLCGTVQGGVTYSWTPGGQATQTATGLSAGTYTVNMNIGCGEDFQATCTVGASSAAPTITASASPTSICAGSSTTLTAGGGATTYTWTPGSITGSSIVVSPGSTTTYTLNAVTAGCSSSPVTVTVTVNPAPTVTAAASPTTICSGGSTTLTGGGATTYTWNPGALSGSSVVVSPATTTTYTVTGTASGCTNTATVTVTVNPTPTVSPSASPSTICSGNSTTLTGTGATSYTWNPGALSGSSVVVSPATTTTYTLVGTTSGCSSSPQTVTVTVNPTPTVTASASPSPICSGNTSTLTGTGATTYTWNPGALSGSSVVVTPGTTTTYTLVGTTTGCNSAPQTVTVTVNPTPTVTASASPNSICSGGSSTLTGGGATSYTWNPGALSGSSVVVSPATTTTYTLTGTTGGCTSAPQTVTITVTPTPTVTATASPTTICSGSSSTLTGTGATTYTWNPGALSGSSVVVSPATTTTYTLVGTTGCPSAPQTVTITVNPTPTVTASASPTTICSGNSSTLTGGGATTYTWNPGALSGSSVVVTPATTTTYTLVGTTTGCSSAPLTITVTVNPTPTVTATASPATICSGNSTTLTGGGATTYTWNPGALSGSSVVVSPATTTTYTLVGTSAGCTGAPQTVTVTVNPTPTVTASASPTTICSGNSSTLTGTGATTYTWNPGALSGSSVVVTPATTTTYTLVGTTTGCTSAPLTVTVTVNPTPTVTATASPATICSGNSTTLTGGGATTYTWNPGALSGSSVVVTPATTTTYTLVGTSTGCTSAPLTVTVTVNPTPTVTATASPTTICSGNSTTLTGTGATTYTWNPGALSGSSVVVSPATTTTYTLVGTSAGCTGAPQTVTVTVNPTPTVTASAAPTTICSGGSTTLTGTGATTYTWNPGALSGSSVVVSPGTTTTYTLVGTTTGCPSGPKTVTITVNPTPTVTASGAPLTICSGNSTTLTGTGATTYTWNPGALSGSSVVVSPGTTTTYTLVGTTTGCSSAPQTVVISVNPTPTLSVNPPSATICPSSSVLFTASGASSYTWSPGTGLSATNTASVTASPGSTTTYTVTGTSASGCPAAPVTVTVTVAASLTISVASSSPTICTGGTGTTLTASGGATYTWKPGTGLSGTTGAVVTANPGTTQTYTVIGSSGGCSDSTTVTVTVNTTPTVTITTLSGSPTICSGDSIAMTAATATSYAWSPGTGLNCTSCPDPNASPGGTTTYTVTGTSNGCSTTASITITVNPTPTITVTPASGAICAGTSTTITAGGAGSYTWSPSGSLSSSTGSPVTANPGSTTTYTVIGTTAAGCIDSGMTTITVNPLPVITVVPPTPAICVGNQTQITASGASSYVWTNSTGLTNTTYDTTTANPSTTTTYTVTGTDGNSCTNTQTVTVTVNPLPTITVVPPSPAICPNGSVVLTAGGASSYVWTNSTGLTNTTFDTTTAFPTTTTTYTVTGTDGNGCTNTQTVTISVVGTLVVTVTPASPAICAGNSTTLTAGGAANYTWSPATGLSATNTSVVTASPATTTTYTVVGSSGACSDSTTVVLTVNPNPTVTVTPPTASICPGDSVSLTAAGAPGYAWSPGTGLNCTGCPNPNASPGGTTTYTVTGTDANGCTATQTATITVNPLPILTVTPATPAICAGSQTQMTAGGANTYLWKPAGGLTNTTYDTTTANPGTTTTYTVVGTSLAGCTDSMSVTVTVNPLPTIGVSASSMSICTGNSSTLTATGGSTYTWSPGTGLSGTTGAVVTTTVTTTTQYTVTGTNASGCSDTISITIQSNPSPIVGISLSGNDTLCPSQTITLTGTGATTYVWSNASTNNPITVGSAGTYSVVGSNGTCSDSATVTIYSYPALTLAVTSDTICSGKVTQIGAIATGGKSGYSYTWTPNIGSSSGPYSVSPASSTYYVVSVTDGCGTSMKDSGQVYVVASAVARFTASPDTILGGEYVSFINQSTGATTYFWNLGNGVTNNDTTPYMQYTQPGSYTVFLVASNGKGCIDTAWDTVYVTEGITVPNVFTPNGDGKNDVFHVTAGGLKTYSIEIFNRWGERVFQANSPEIDWTGKSESGVVESDGTYFYEIKATDFKDKIYNLDGYIQLIGNKNAN